MAPNPGPAPKLEQGSLSQHLQAPRSLLWDPQKFSNSNSPREPALPLPLHLKSNPPTWGSATRKIPEFNKHHRLFFCSSHSSHLLPATLTPPARMLSLASPPAPDVPGRVSQPPGRYHCLTSARGQAGRRTQSWPPAPHGLPRAKQMTLHILDAQNCQRREKKNPGEQRPKLLFQGHLGNLRHRLQA